MGKRGGQRFIKSLYPARVFRGSLFHLPVFLRNDGRVAQLVEQVTFNHWVTGSNPVALTIPLLPPALYASVGLVMKGQGTEIDKVAHPQYLF